MTSIFKAIDHKLSAKLFLKLKTRENPIPDKSYQVHMHILSFLELLVDLQEQERQVHVNIMHTR